MDRDFSLRQRRTVRSGYADVKSSSITSRFSRQWLCLTENELLFFKDSMTASSGSSPLSSFSCREIAATTRATSRPHCLRVDAGRKRLYLAFKGENEAHGWHNDLRLQRRPILVIGPTPIHVLFSGPVSGGGIVERKGNDEKAVEYGLGTTSTHVYEVNVLDRRTDTSTDSDATSTPSSSPGFGAFSPLPQSSPPYSPPSSFRTAQMSGRVAVAAQERRPVQKSKSRPALQERPPPLKEDDAAHRKSLQKSKSRPNLKESPRSTRHAVEDEVWDLSGFVRRSGAEPMSPGGFADLWKGEIRRGRISGAVAIKALRSFSSRSTAASIVQNQLNMALRTWQRLRHKHVLPVLGVCFDICHCTSVISPWMEASNVSVYFEGKDPRATLLPRLNALGQVASGLQYLHAFDPPVIHGNLKAANVLINAHGEAVLSDFGLSSIIGAAAGATYFTSSAFAGSVRWMAFELLRPDVHETPQLTSRCDIWSYGSLCLEILTSRVPYHHIESDREVVHEIMRGIKPKHTGTGISPDIRMFIESCWRDDPARRPSASAASRALKILRDDRVGYLTTEA